MGQQLYCAGCPILFVRHACLSAGLRAKPVLPESIVLIHRFLTVGNAWLALAYRALKRYPKRFNVVVAALMLAAGGAAVAITSLAPDVSELPVREVVEAVTPLPPLAELQQQTMRLYRSDVTRSSDTADTLLKRLGINDPAAAAFLRSDAKARLALGGRAGRNVTAEASADNTLLKLSARWKSDGENSFKRLVLEKTPQGFVSRLDQAALSASQRLASASVESSLFAATDEAGIPDAVANQVVEILSGDIDFHRGLHKGDRLSVLYEVLEADGEPLASGRVLSVEFVNRGKTHQAMWFEDATANARGKGAYYTLDGRSLQRAFLASPVAYTRITSGFKMRFHPLLQVWKKHEGVDYAAPSGTPVRSVGEAVVDFAGVQNGYGNVVILKHANGYKTVYAHLSRILVRKGQSVSQGQSIGAVGATGWATGPHLHFEYRVNGIYRNPQTLSRFNESVPLSAAAKPVFAARAVQHRVALAAAAAITSASAQ